ncbi:MAG: outer membrane beta-barrel protein [Taibaiella sp.]|nr:outer membrane beta-barrel protein [Taibaiella sp.]
MKKLLLLIAVVPAITATVAHAQPRKGDWMVGANIAGLSGYVDPGVKSHFDIHIVPSAGYFFTNRLAIGTGVGLGYHANSKKAHGFNYGVSPFLRYYFSKKEGMVAKKAYLFTEVSAGYNGYTYSDKVNNVKLTNNALHAGGGAGLAYFITQNVSIEGLFKVNYSTGINGINNNLAQFRPSLGIGFNIYLPGRKKESAKTE